MSPLAMHDNYAALAQKAAESHEQSRSPAGIADADVMLARLYSYAFRLHTIGAFHATRQALRDRPAADPLSGAHRQRAVEALEDLQHQGMEPVPGDFRAVISTFHRYHRNVSRVLDALQREVDVSARDPEISRIGARFRDVIDEITAGNGIHVTRDDVAPAQASFVVPNLGITIVPLVYGDHHSWNLAFLPDPATGVPTHLHHQGVEIHLGFEPLKGSTILGEFRAGVEEGYAMPIPPETPHGYANAGSTPHHVPFIFGSLRHGGWGVFLDVEPVPRPPQSFREVPRGAPAFSQMIYLQREIRAAQRSGFSRRVVLIPATVTNRDGSGGLELAVARVDARGYAFPRDFFRIVSIVGGEGSVEMAGQARSVRPRDHFGIPAGMAASMKQTSDEPLVVLDAVIRSAPGARGLVR